MRRQRVLGKLDKLPGWNAESKGKRYVARIIYIWLFLGIITLPFADSGPYEESGTAPSQISGDLTDDDKKALIEAALTLKGYDVVRVGLFNERRIRDGATVVMPIVSMKPVYGSEIDVAEQIGSGIGALYGAWDSMDYYAVDLDNGTNICMFGIDGNTVRRYIETKEITDLEFFLALESECI